MNIKTKHIQNIVVLTSFMTVHQYWLKQWFPPKVYQVSHGLPHCGVHKIAPCVTEKYIVLIEQH